jgi:mannose/fructose/N-acetylgalactosamine-specific phosphotransferase system component IIB
MPLSLVRIDDRLIHGQIVLGWARVLKPDRIVLANNRIVQSEWERKFYTSSVPPHIKVSFLSLDETARELLNNLFKNESIIMLFEGVEDVCYVVEKGIRFPEINIGGLHFKEDARELLPYVYVTERDRGMLRELVKKGIKLLAQDIPGNAPKVINSLVV